MLQTSKSFCNSCYAFRLAAVRLFLLRLKCEILHQIVKWLHKVILIMIMIMIMIIIIIIIIIIMIIKVLKNAFYL